MIPSKNENGWSLGGSKHGSGTNKGSTTSLSSFYLNYRALRRMWFVAFVIGIVGNLWLNISHDSIHKQQLSSGRDVTSQHGKWLLSEFTRQQQRKGSSTIISSTNNVQGRVQQDGERENLIQFSSHPNQQTSSSVAATSNTDNDTDGFSICLLIKDDNDLLNEWIAYHYHVLQMRTLIVAIDPSSLTSPQDILHNWHDTFPDLHVETWSDERYMPDFFLQKQYDLVPRMIKWGDTGKKWMVNTTTTTTTDGVGGADETEESTISKQEQETFQHVNNHRYRQSLFLRECIHTLQEQNKTWMTHIDTDEYVVINPQLRKQGIAGNVTTPTKLYSSTIYKFLKDLVELNSLVVNWPCISLPRLLFGSIKDDGDDNSGSPKPKRRRSVMMNMFNITQFETYSWKYHTSYTNDKLNRLPKVIIDVSGFPKRNTSQYAIRKVFSIHRPSIDLCRKQGQIDFYNGRKYPISVNHYVGTYDRYLARNDPRRNINVSYV